MVRRRREAEYVHTSANSIELKRWAERSIKGLRLYPLNKLYSTNAMTLRSISVMDHSIHTYICTH